MANFLQNFLDSIRGVARTPQTSPSTKKEGVGTALKSFGSSVVEALRPLGTSMGEAVYWKTGGEKENERITQSYFDNANRLSQKAKSVTDPIQRKRLYDLANQNLEMAKDSVWQPTYKPREIIGSAAKTAGLTLGLPHLGLGGVLIPGAIGGIANKAQGGSFSEGAGRGVAETAPYIGLAGQVTTPALTKALPFVQGSRPLQAGLNVAEGYGLSQTMNQPYSTENLILDAFLGGTLRPFGNKVVTPTEQKILATPQAKKVLSDWMNETQAQTKARQAAGLSPQEAYGAVNKVVGSEKFNSIFARWIGKRDAARTTGTQEPVQLKAIPKELGPEIISYMEGGTTKSQEVRNIASGLRTRFNELYNEAKASGLDIHYLKNYITHIWEQTPEEVEALYKGLGTKIGKREIPTYEKGVELGLTPKFTQPGQILGEYARRIEEMKANLELITSLKKEGLIVPAGKAESGMVPLIGPGFPKSRTKTAAGETVIGEYYARPEIAKDINKVFSPEEVNPIIKTAAKISGGIQDVGLAGGLPFTPLNAWTFAQVMWGEVPAGRVRGPLKALWVSMTNANKYFEENSDVIKTMQRNNIPVNTSLDVESTGRNWLQNAIGTSLGEAWHKAVNEPTFKRFMPAMQIEFFKDSYNAVLKSTKSEALAEQTASAATKNFYGIVSSDALAKEGALGQNIKQIFLFAPRYRQTMLNFLWNTAKAMKNPLAPENRANVKWLMGAIISYGIFDFINLQTTGHHLVDNPPGTEDKLLVPAGGGHTVGIPWMSSRLTLPRAAYRAGRELLRGDIGGAVGEVVSTGTAMGLKSVGEAILNRDYFGREITPENAPTGEKLKDYATYIALQTMHPYLKETLDPRYQNDPAYQRLSRAAELPLRFYEDKSLESRWYYDSQDSVKRSLTSDQQKLYDQVYSNPKPTTQVGKIQQDQLEARILLAHPELIDARKEVVMRTAIKTGQAVDPFFLLTPTQQKVVLQRQASNPGDSDNGLTSQNIDWLKDYWNARSDYFDKLNLPQGQQLEGPKLETSQKILDLQDSYFKLPYGTGSRTAFLKSHPELANYWNEKSQYENELRVQMGLPPIPAKTYGGGWGKSSKAKKPTKLSGAVPKTKVTKIKPLKSLFAPLKFKKFKVRKLG